MSQNNYTSYESKSQVCIGPQPSPEVFRKHFAELSRLVSESANRLALEPELYTNHVITKEYYDITTDNSSKTDMEKGQMLMKGLMSTIKEQPQLTPLIDSLKKVDAFKSVAKKMEFDLSQTCTENAVTSSDIGM